MGVVQRLRLRSDRFRTRPELADLRSQMKQSRLMVCSHGAVGPGGFGSRPLTQVTPCGSEVTPRRLGGAPAWSIVVAAGFGKCRAGPGQTHSARASDGIVGNEP